MTQLLTINEVSEKIGFSPRTIYDWAASGKIPHHRIHGRLRFDESKIEVWLSYKEVKTKKQVQLTPALQQ